MALRVLVDLNVVLDVVQHRVPFYEDSAQVLAAAEAGAVEGWLAAHSFTTLYYLYAKHHSSEAARAALTQLLAFLRVAPVTQATIERGLQLPYEDFEDAVQMASAQEVGADYVVTRNPGDFSAGPVPVVRPVELLALLSDAPGDADSEHE